MPTIPQWCDTSMTGGRPGSSGSLTREAGPSGAGGRAESGSDSDEEADRSSRGEGAGAGAGSGRGSSSGRGRGRSRDDSDVSAAGPGGDAGGAWTRFDGEVRAYESWIRKEVAVLLTSMSQGSGLTPSDLLRLHPPTRWGIQKGDCTGVLKLIVEACLNRYAPSHNVLHHHHLAPTHSAPFLGSCYHRRVCFSFLFFSEIPSPMAFVLLLCRFVSEVQ
jgi:hypothetical protein